MSSPFVTTVDVRLAAKMQRDLSSQGFEITHPQHTHFAARKTGVSLTLYTSGKLVVQGKEMKELIEFYLEPEILKDFSYSSPAAVDTTARIGSDEAGKGDYFGPLCVCSAYAAGDEVEWLKSIGVGDSKTLSDVKIAQLAEKIAARLQHNIVRINPQKYNELYERFGNLNTLLAWAHATAIDGLVERTGCTRVIVDQFAYKSVMERAVGRKNKKLDLIQRTKAEEDLVVAAASILARWAFVQGIDALGKQVGMVLPKGASPAVLAAGKKLYAEQGKEALSRVAKLHFKTTKEIIGA
ncbi:MAG: ribonuclease HIII [Chlamydiia bacterium]|nr:ribonuclease HIII [Chlamydiia bacterium]